MSGGASMTGTGAGTGERKQGRGKGPVGAVEIMDRVHWIGALDPELRTFDIVLKTANGTTYNAYTVRGSAGVAVIDTVKHEFTSVFLERLEEIADYHEITALVLNHLEPDHTGVVPELLRRAPNAHIYVSHRGLKVLRALLKDDFEKYKCTMVDTGDRVSLGDRTPPSSARLMCIGPIPSALILKRASCCLPAIFLAVISATTGCSMTASAISGLRLNTILSTS